MQTKKVVAASKILRIVSRESSPTCWGWLWYPNRYSNGPIVRSGGRGRHGQDGYGGCFATLDLSTSLVPLTLPWMWKGTYFLCLFQNVSSLRLLRFSLRARTRLFSRFDLFQLRINRTGRDHWLPALGLWIWITEQRYFLVGIGVLYSVSYMVLSLCAEYVDRIRPTLWPCRK